MADDPLSALQGMPTDSDVGNTAAGADDGPLTALKNMPTDDDVAGPPPEAPPTRHIGPPRVHAAVHQPRPHPPSGGTATGAVGPAPPGAPEPPAPTWQQVPGLFLKNIVPSMAESTSDMIDALKPTNWGKDVAGMKHLVKGSLANMGAQVGASTEDQQIAQAVWAAKKAQWGFGPEGSAGLRRSLAYHPGENVLDVGTAAAAFTPLAELAAARTTGSIADLAATAARASDLVEAASNPLGYPFRAASLAKSGIGAVSRGASAADDIADSIRAAKSLHPTEPISREMITGEAAPTEIAGDVTRSRANWKGHAGQAAADIAGSDAPDDAALGANYAAAHTASNNAIPDAYEAVANHQGQFYPSFAPTLQHTVDTTLAAHNLPPVTGPGNLQALGSYPQTVAAMNHMNTQVADLATQGALTPKNLMAVRQSMNPFYDAARGSDIKGIRTMQEALDNHIASQGGGGVYQGGNGAAVANDMKAAIDARVAHTKNFGDQSPSSKAAGILQNNQITDGSGRITGYQPGTNEAVTAQLGKDLLNPTNLKSPINAPVLYPHLESVMGGTGSPGATALNDYVRQSVLRTNNVGSKANLAANPDHIQSFLKGPLGRSAFPDVAEHQQVANLAKVDKLASAQPSKATRAGATLSALAGKGARHAASMWVGSHFGPFGPWAGEAFASHVIDPMFARGAARAQFRVPRGFRGTRPLAKLGPVATGISRTGLGARAGWGATYQTPQEQQAEAEKNDRDIVAAAPPVADVAKGANMGKAPAATPTDIDTVVRMAAAEGDPTPEGWKAVAAVMRNRSLESGHTLSDLAAEPRQFEAYGNRNYTSLQPGSPQYQRILAAIAPVMAGKEDPTDGADQYYAPGLQARLGRKPPTWDDGTGEMIGTQRFFKHKYRRADGGEVVAKNAQWTVPKTSRGHVERGEEVVIPTDVAKLDNDWKHERDFYVGPGGTHNAIGNRYQRFGEFASKTTSPIEMSEVGLGPGGRPFFTNGRHRYAWMRDHGVSSLPMVVPAEQADEFHARYGAGPREERASGGNVISLADRLLSRAETHAKASRAATKPLLGLDDNTVAKALAIASKAI